MVLVCVCSHPRRGGSPATVLARQVEATKHINSPADTEQVWAEQERKQALRGSLPSGCPGGRDHGLQQQAAAPGLAPH